MTKNSLKALLLTASSLVVAALPAGAADLKSPDQVKNALRILAYVQDDMARKLPTKSYARLPHENEEFQEAAPALRDAIAGEPSELKAKVEARLKKAQATANNVAEVSKSNDDAKISAAVKAVADDLQSLDELFPMALRPVPGELGGRPVRGAVGPPADPR
jgi:hypothetical protein